MRPSSDSQTSLWIPITEAASRTPYTASFLRQLARKGKLHAEKIGRDWLITEADLHHFLKEQSAHHEQALLALHEAAQGTTAQAEPRSSAPVSLATRQAGFAGLKVLLVLGAAILAVSSFLGWQMMGGQRGPHIATKAAKESVASASGFPQAFSSFGQFYADELSAVFRSSATSLAEQSDQIHQVLGAGSVKRIV